MTAIWQKKYYSKSVSGDITLLNQWYLFDHVARASPRGWSSESFAGGNLTCGRMEKTKRTPLNNLDMKREERSCAAEYSPQLRHKVELAGVVLYPQPRSGMGFDSDYDDDDIYDSEHCLNGPADLAWKRFWYNN